MNFSRFDACAAQVNIHLFNAAVYLAITTTDAGKQIPALKQQLNAMIWYEHTDSRATFEPHGIRYLGELLERYAEKLGDTQANLRAVALALAWLKPILSDGMFVGSQRADFLKAVRKAAPKDIYLTGALYRLAEGAEQETLRKTLLQWDYTRIEDVLFALCALDGCAEAFPSLRPRIARLLSTERTLPIEGNTGLLAWLLIQYRMDILACRKKDNAVLRALVRLMETYVRPHDRAWAILREAGYSPEEILLANSRLVWEPWVGICDHRLPENSIPAEKLAAAYVAACLNGETLPSQPALDYILWLLDRYRNFVIRYEGNCGLWEAVVPLLHITCPAVMAWMAGADLKYEYRFDALDGKWDELAVLLPPEKYHALFRDQLEALSEPDAETVRRMLGRYQALTGAAYTEAFQSFDYGERGAFRLLASHGLLHLRQFFEAHRDDASDVYRYSPLRYVWEYASPVTDLRSFAFWRWFFEAYTPAGVPRFWPGEAFHRNFVHFYSYNRRLDCLRACLSREENRQLYDWIDHSVFILEPGNYSALVQVFLQSEAESALFDVDELRPVASQLLRMEPENASVRNLRWYYMTEAERAEEQAARVRAEEERKRAKKEREYRRTEEILTQRYDGSFRSLYEALESFRPWDEHRTYALEILAGRLSGLMEKCAAVPAVDFGYLLRLSGLLVAAGRMLPDSAVALLRSVQYANEEKEETDHADA